MVIVIFQQDRFIRQVTSLIIVGILAVVSIFIGVQNLTLVDLFSLTDSQRIVLFSTRIPRTISLILAGATLSVSGLLMQQLTQNKFVSPTTAGTMSSARLGVVLALVLFGSQTFFHQILFAFLFATVGTFIFTLFLRQIKSNRSIMVPLVGMMLGNIIGSVGTFFALRYEVVQNVTSWLQGNFSMVSSSNYLLIYLAIPILIVIYLFAHYFTVMSLGKDIVTELGVSYHRIELIGIVVVALGTTAVLLTAGSIPFLGIIVPNLVAMKVGDNFRQILFPTAVIGAGFTLISDMVARLVIYPYELPISVVVGILGSVLFLYLLLRGEHHV